MCVLAVRCKTPISILWLRLCSTKVNNPLLVPSNTADHLKLTQHKNQFSIGRTVSIVETEQETTLAAILDTTWRENIIEETIPIYEPVYVEKNENGEDERIVYNSSSMDLGKRYELIFKGENGD